MAGSGHGETYKISLEYLVVPESKKVFLKKKMMVYAEGTQQPTRRAPTAQSWHHLNHKMK